MTSWNAGRLERLVPLKSSVSTSLTDSSHGSVVSHKTILLSAGEQPMRTGHAVGYERVEGRTRVCSVT